MTEKDEKNGRNLSPSRGEREKRREKSQTRGKRRKPEVRTEIRCKTGEDVQQKVGEGAEDKKEGKSRRSRNHCEEGVRMGEKDKECCKERRRKEKVRECGGNEKRRGRRDDERGKVEIVKMG